MMRYSLMRSAPLALALSAPYAVNAQTGNASPVQRPSAEEDGAPICISVLHRREKIAIGQGTDKLEITMSGGACEPPCSGISRLDVHAEYDFSGDAVEASLCPAFQAQISERWSARQRYPRGSAIEDVQAGPFIISDWSDLFDLQSAAGREEADQWLKKTFEAVRPCWNTLRLVKRLYKELGLKPPMQRTE